MICAGKSFYGWLISVLLLCVIIGAVFIGISQAATELDTDDAGNWEKFVNEFRAEHDYNFNGDLHPYYRFEITDPEMESALRKANPEITEEELKAAMSWTGPSQKYGIDNYVKVEITNPDGTSSFTHQLKNTEEARAARETEYIKRFFDDDGKYKLDARVEYNARNGERDIHTSMVKRFVKDRDDFFEGGEMAETAKKFSKIARYTVGGALGVGAAAAAVRECFMMKERHTLRKGHFYLVWFLVIAGILAILLATSGKTVISYCALSVLTLSIFGIVLGFDRSKTFGSRQTFEEYEQREKLAEEKREEEKQDRFEREECYRKKGAKQFERDYRPMTKEELELMHGAETDVSLKNHEPSDATSSLSAHTEHDAQVDAEATPQNPTTRRLLNEIQSAML